MILGTLFFGTLSCGVAIFVVVASYYHWCYQYWQRQNLQCLRLPNGTKEHYGVKLRDIYKTMKKKGWKHGGIYKKIIPSPVYLPIDLEYVKNILTKDFRFFMDRGMYYNQKSDPLSAHLFNISGTKWNSLRHKLNPAFSSGKIRKMFQIMTECEAKLSQRMAQEYRKGNSIDIKDILSCFTMEVVGSCAFGLDCQSLTEPNSPFLLFRKKLFNRSFMRQFKRTFAYNFPKLAKMVGIGLVPKEVSQFFIKMIEDVIRLREENKVTRYDFLQLLIDLKREYNEGGTLSLEEIAALSFGFFTAGFVTSSTTMTFALYELSKNQNVQDKLRDEIYHVMKSCKETITYESLQGLKYMDQVINETLRKYPPAPFLQRKCVEDYKIAGEDPVIRKGASVLVSVLGIHYDDDYYPDPERFDPGRFNEENRKFRHNYAFIPFGEGPRVCIGMRFGLIQIKLGLMSLIKNFIFTLSPKTKEPLRMKSKTVVLEAQGEIWLIARKI